MTTESNRDLAARGAFAVDYFNPTAAPPRYVEVPGVPGGPMLVGRPPATPEEAAQQRGAAAAGVDAEAQPAPAPGQVWAPPPVAAMHAALDGTLTIEHANDGSVYFCEPFGCAAAWMTDPAGGWRCLGAATPHGRVMVGDGFRSSPHAEGTVVAVQGTLVRWEMADGWGGWHEATSLVGGSGPLRWERTRYATARPGERYRWRAMGSTLTILPPAPGDDWLLAEDAKGKAPLRAFCGVRGDPARLDAALWERLDPPAPGAAAAPSPLYTYALAQLTARGVTVTDGTPIAVLLAHEPRLADRGLWMVAPDGSRTRAEGAPDEVVWAPGPAGTAPFSGAPAPTSLAAQLAGQPGYGRAYSVPRRATLAGCPIDITLAHAATGAVSLHAYVALADFEQRLRPCLDDGRYVRFELDGVGYTVSVRPGWSACPSGVKGTAQLTLMVAEGPPAAIESPAAWEGRWHSDAPGGLPAPTPPSHLDALSRPSPAPEPSAEEAARRFWSGEGERVAPARLTGWAEARHPWQMRGR